MLKGGAVFGARCRCSLPEGGGNAARDLWRGKGLDIPLRYNVLFRLFCRREMVRYFAQFLFMPTDHTFVQAVGPRQRSATTTRNRFAFSLARGPCQIRFCMGICALRGIAKALADTGNCIGLETGAGDLRKQL